MALQGNLEDLPLLDIIQIVSFSKKTGYLSIEMEGGDGAIVFLEGLVVSAFTATSPPADPRLGSLPKEAREKAVRGRIGFALEQLARLREGAFGFELTDDVPAVVGRRDIRLETLARGIHPQEMLLDLAQGLDDDRVQSAAAVEASFAAPEEGALAEEPIVPGAALSSDLRAAAGAPSAPPPPPRWQTSPVPRHGTDTRPLPKVMLPPASPPLAPPSPPPPAPGSASEPRLADREAARVILLVDDEQDVRAILGRHFAAAGFRIVEAGDPDEAAKAAGLVRAQDGPFVLVTDLGMPASGGASFHGGFEVVKRLWKMNLRPPVLMMTESLDQSLRLRARQMGVQSFVFKPTLSKLNARQFEADLQAFAEKMMSDVLPKLASSPPAERPVQKAAPPSGTAAQAAVVSPGEEELSHEFSFLQRRLAELRQPGNANQVAILVVKVAREFFERGILFLVKNDEARGLGGFGLAPRGESLNLLARQVVLPLTDPSPLQEVVQHGRSFVGPLPADRWSNHLMGRIGRFQAGTIALLPLVAHRETIAVLYGDNPETGRELPRLPGLELFVHQAGIVLENTFLQRKLQSLQEKG